MTLSVVILAAGKSTRFKSQTPKVLYPLGERPMLTYSLDLAAQVSDTPPVIVVGPETEAAIREWGGDRARYVLQERRLGTGHAVLQARELLEGEADRVLVLYGDMPLLRAETLHKLQDHHERHEAALTLLTIVRDDSQGFGRVVRDVQGFVEAVVEEVEATPEIAAIRELNTGVYVFEAGFLWPTLEKIQPSPRKGEYYLTDMVELAAQAGRPVAATAVDDPSEVLGINTRADLAVAMAALRRRINTRWMLEGVTLVDPATAYIGPNVRIGRDTTIHPNTHLRGETTIGEGCEIGPNTMVESCTIGERCTVLASVLEYAEMEAESDIGPFSHLRKGARVAEGAHVGNFGEIKNSTLGPGAKMGHFSYLGDAQVGENVNIGAGTITCNYDGQRKHPTVIEPEVFIGSGSMLVAPLYIGPGAKTGAGSVVTRDVPPHTLVYGVPARPRKQIPEAKHEAARDESANAKQGDDQA